MPDALERAISLLNQGLAIIGENEVLYAALGYAHYDYFRWVSKAHENHLQKANEYLQKTIAINPTSSHGFTLQGLLQCTAGNIGEAIRSMKQAISIDPSNSEAMFWLAVYHSWVGRNSEAKRYADNVISLDPLFAMNINIKGVTYIYNGEFAEGMKWIQRGFEMDPGSPLLRWTMTIAVAWQGKGADPITHIDILAQQAPGWVYTKQALFLKHAWKGEKEMALQYATADLAVEAKHDLHFALHVAHCYALINEKDKALDFLEHSVKMGMLNYQFLSKHDPLLENLRGEERFKKLMERVKMLQEQLVV